MERSKKKFCFILSSLFFSKAVTKLIIENLTECPAFFKKIIQGRLLQFIGCLYIKVQLHMQALFILDYSNSYENVKAETEDFEFIKVLSRICRIFFHSCRRRKDWGEHYRFTVNFFRVLRREVNNDDKYHFLNVLHIYSFGGRYQQII